MRALFIVLRVIVGVAIASAIVAQLAHTVEFLLANGSTQITFYVTNFFSFFTVDSNASSVVVLLVGAALGIRWARQAGGGRKTSDPLLFTTVRAAVTTYMVTTGIVYNLLLRNIELPQGQTVEWSNEILHVIGPIYLLLDWLFAPGRSPLPWRRLWAIIAFPIVWVVYTLVRGVVAIDPATGRGWYPYPFLDPSISANGYLSVAFYVLLIALVICSIGAGVIATSRRLAVRER